MDLNDLLVSYKVVDVPKRTIPSIPTISTIEYFTHDTPAVESKTSVNEVIETPTTNYYISSITAPGFKKTKQSNKWENPYKKNKNKWVEDLTRAYTKAGIKNDNALKMLISQDALESRWGRSAQGKFNFGNLTTGAKWKGDYITGNDKNAKGEAIKQKFRSYNSIDEYAADKLQFLRRLYDFDENDDIDKFVAKLTGSNRGKRKYAEATNYASSLKGVFDSFKKGGVIKAQVGTIMPDNTRVARPIIQERITRTYQIPEQPQFVQDNRSDWQKQQSQKKAKAAYNQYMEIKNTEKGLRNLNGFLTFTDYATMGLGAGSLLTKGLGSLLTKGLIKQVGKRAVGQISKQIANGRNIVAKPFQRGGFQSELDWSPKSWFEKAAGRTDYTQADIDALAAHVPEYHEIERVAKANGTWLKMPDGSTWKGDARSWVQLMSKDGQKLSKKVWWHGDTDRYVTKTGEDITAAENGKRILWGSSEPHVARSYTLADERIVPAALKEGHRPIKSIDAEGRNWRAAYKKGDEYYDTNTFSLENLKDGEYLTINNVVDRGSNPIPKNSKYYIESLPNELYSDYLKRVYLGDDIIIGQNTPRKFLIGNNGNFDLSVKNVYRGFVPLGIAGGYEINNKLQPYTGSKYIPKNYNN